MTKLMEEAIEKLRTMPEDQQDSFARFLLWELEEDRRWEETTERYAHKLDKMIENIRAAEQRGELEELDPDRL